MTGSKIFIVVLIIFALLFVGGVGIGLHQNDAQPDPHNYSPPGWTNALSDWLSPSLDLKTVRAVTGAPRQVPGQLREGNRRGVHGNERLAQAGAGACS